MVQIPPELYQWYKIGILVAIMPDAWSCLVRTRTGLPHVSIMWLGEIASFISGWQRVESEQIDLRDIFVCCWDVEQPTNTWGSFVLHECSVKNNICVTCLQNATRIWRQMSAWQWTALCTTRTHATMPHRPWRVILQNWPRTRALGLPLLRISLSESHGLVFVCVCVILFFGGM